MGEMPAACSSSEAGGQWHGLVAGLVAGASGVLVGHAFDTAKVQAQVGQSTAAGSGFSLLQLYRGILPPLLTTGATRSLYFGVLETMKPPVAAALGVRGDASGALSVTFVAGAGTGLATAIVTAPIQRVKLIQQTGGGSLLHCVRRLVATSGVRGFFRGLGLHCALETFGSACYLSSYHAAKLWATSNSAHESAAREPLYVRIGCGMVAGCGGWLSIYPLDVLRSRVMSVTPEAGK